MATTFKQFAAIAEEINEDVTYEYGLPILSEAIHSEIQGILDSQQIPPSDKLSLVTQNARNLIKQGQDTGLDSDKPKKGSSRAVFFPSEHKKIILDGQETYVPTAVKIAFPGILDKHTGSRMLLGEHQNMIEGHVDNSGFHSVLRKVGQNEYVTNHDGVLAPIFSAHPDGHYLEMGRCEKYMASDVRNHTKKDGFKAGLSHQQIQNHMLIEHHAAHGASYGQSDLNDAISNHPHVESMVNMMHDYSMHPADLRTPNMGTWVHPHTGHRYPVVIDYGFSNEIAKLYRNARLKRADQW